MDQSPKSTIPKNRANKECSTLYCNYRTEDSKKKNECILVIDKYLDK